MNSHTSFTPKARSERLVIQSVDNELLVYDLQADRAHCLNEAAAFIWQQCDGQRSMAEIAGVTAKRFDTTEAGAAVEYALMELAERNLLSFEAVERAAAYRGNRRKMLKDLALATAVAIPVISSVIAPSSAYASISCFCLTGAQCLGQQPGCPTGATVCSSQGICVPPNITVTVPAGDAVPRQ